MRIVSAGMHKAIVFRCIACARFFPYWQRIHIRAQYNAFAGPGAADVRGYCAVPSRTDIRYAQLLKLACNIGGCFLQPLAGFRYAVQCAPHFHQLALYCGAFAPQRSVFHAVLLYSAALFSSIRLYSSISSALAIMKWPSSISLQHGGSAA